MYVAVVYKDHNAKNLMEIAHATLSHRGLLGDWSCFLGATKAEAVRRALDATKVWERDGYGPYQVLVGKLTEEATPVVEYDLKAFVARN